MKNNKNGFTLIELLAVIVIIGIVSTIATIGIHAMIDKSKENLFATKQKMIVEGAILYGQNNRNSLASCKDPGTNINDYCNNETLKNCLPTIGYLLNNKYLSSQEKCVDTSNNNYTCLTNNITGKSLNDDKVYVYLKDNQVYAQMCPILSD